MVVCISQVLVYCEIGVVMSQCARLVLFFHASPKEHLNKSPFVMVLDASIRHEQSSIEFIPSNRSSGWQVQKQKEEEYYVI